MPTLLERVAEARDNRAHAEAEFRAALIAARESHSWDELADVAGLSKGGVRYLVQNDKPKGEQQP